MKISRFVDDVETQKTILFLSLVCHPNVNDFEMNGDHGDWLESVVLRFDDYYYYSMLTFGQTNGSSKQYAMESSEIRYCSLFADAVSTSFRV